MTKMILYVQFNQEGKKLVDRGHSLIALARKEEINFASHECNPLQQIMKTEAQRQPKENIRIYALAIDSNTLETCRHKSLLDKSQFEVIGLVERSEVMYTQYSVILNKNFTDKPLLQTFCKEVRDTAYHDNLFPWAAYLNEYYLDVFADIGELYKVEWLSIPSYLNSLKACGIYPLAQGSLFAPKKEVIASPEVVPPVNELAQQDSLRNSH